MIFSLRNVASIKENLIYLFLLIRSFLKGKKSKLHHHHLKWRCASIEMWTYQSLCAYISSIYFFFFPDITSTPPSLLPTFSHDIILGLIPGGFRVSYVSSHATNGYLLHTSPLVFAEMNSFSHILLFHVSCQW